MNGRLLLEQPGDLGDGAPDLAHQPQASPWPAPGVSSSGLPRVGPIPDVPPYVASARTVRVLDVAGSGSSFGALDLAHAPLGRRGMLAAIAGSTVGLAVLMSGCADDAVEEAVEKARAADATLPDPKLTPAQPMGPVAPTTTEPLGPPAPDPSAALEVPSLGPPSAGPPPAGPPAAGAVPTAATAATPSGAPTVSNTTSVKPSVPAAAAPVAPGVVAVAPPVAPPPAPVPPAPTSPAPAPPAPPPPPPPPPPPGPTAAELDAMHRVQLLGNVAFGSTPDVVAEMAALGPAAFLEQQLAIPPAGTDGVLTGTHSLDADIATRFQLYRNQDSRRPAKELQHAAVIRAARHPGQLAERMVEFWTNHFSTYSGEDDKNVRYAIASDDSDVIRVHAMGRFADLLLASARSVSMLLYLDNHRSTGTRPNQNYAREIMELHTMGAGNGYDEADVEQVARIFTGWGLAGRLDTDGLRYEYQPSRHFTGACEVTIVHPDGSVHTFATPERPGGIGGEQDGIDFVNWLARRPNTADYLATKLVRRFVADDPPPSLVASTAAVYLANDTAIVPVLRHILASHEFITSQARKVRSPFELMVSMVRATGAAIDPDFTPTADRPATRTISDHLSRLGQPLWGWPTPDGFPDSSEFWVTTSTTLRRWELAGRFGNRTLNGLAIDTAALLPDPMPATIDLVIRALAARFGVSITQTDVAAVTEFLGVTTDTPVADVRLAENLGDVIGLLLSFPANQYR